MLIRSLQDEGVEYIFGYPGGSALHIYDAIFRQQKIEHILVRHEQAATHMADGYARSTGRPGVVLVTSGHGTTSFKALETVEKPPGPGYIKLTEGEQLTLVRNSTVCMHNGYKVMEVIGSVPRYIAKLKEKRISSGLVREVSVAPTNIMQ